MPAAVTTLPTHQDTPRLAAGLSPTMLLALRAAAAGNLLRSELHPRRVSFIRDGRRGPITRTAEALLARGLVQLGKRELGRAHSTYRVTATGRAVLAHLDARDRGSVGRDVAGVLAIVTFTILMLALFGNW